MANEYGVGGKRNGGGEGILTRRATESHCNLVDKRACPCLVCDGLIGSSDYHEKMCGLSLCFSCMVELLHVTSGLSMYTVALSFIAEEFNCVEWGGEKKR